MATSPVSTPHLAVHRVTKSGDSRELTPHAISRDPLASRARTLVEDFDRFLAQHGGSGDGRIQDGFDVELVAGAGNATGGANGIALGGPSGPFVRHSVHSAELVGHELTHTVGQQVGAATGPGTGEGWADVVGNAFARWRKEPDAQDWRLGEGLMTKDVPRSLRKVIEPGYIRDLANPHIDSVPAMREHLKLLDEEGPRRDDFDTHQLGGVLTRAATLAADRIGAERMGRIYTEAFIHDLADRERAANAGARGAARRMERRTGDWPVEIMYDAEFRAAARATLDAAYRLHGRKSEEFSAISDAWESVGLTGIRWSPRPKG